MDQQPLLDEPQPSAPESGYDYGPPHSPPPVDYPAAKGAPPPYQVPADAPSIQTVILNQQVIYRTAPVQVRCPNCQHEVVTEVSYQSGVLTWLAVIAMFILGFGILVTWFCCCIPLCIKGLKDVKHTCPHCGHACGVYQRLS